MGDKPCHIVPIPKQIALKPSHRHWQKQVAVFCDTHCAKSLVGRYKAELTAHGDGILKISLVETKCHPEGYSLHFENDTLTVSASDTAGFRYALQTLKQICSEGKLPIGTVTDWPALAVRGFHLNFESYRRLDLQQAAHLIRTAGHFKLNTILVEYGPRFPFQSQPLIRTPDALTSEGIEHLHREANDYGIRIVPLQQSLAHLEYALKHEHLSHLRERPEKQNLMCPCDPQSLELFKSLADEVIKLHPNAEWFHLGGDEARKIGRCTRCKATGKERGLGAVYGQYIGDAARWVLEQGRRPIVWDDTLCTFPDAFEHIPKETIITYWDYIAVEDPTPVLIPRMAHANGGPRVAHDWWWSLGRKRGRITDVQHQVMKNYSRPARLRSKLGHEYLGVYGKYLGDAFPRWIRALPYLEYYQDRGHDVITSPTGMGNGDTRDGVPNFERFEHNIQTHAKRCKDNGKALGMITTAWYNMPPELLYQPLIRTAQCAW